MPATLLPSIAEERHTQGATGADLPPPSEFTPTILVADDDDDIRDLITFKLQTAGYRVLATDNGDSALHIIETRLPDAVILDVGMPGMDGFSVCYRLQNLRATIGIPVIIVSSRDSLDDISLGYTIGADDYLTKPFNPPDLLRRLRWQLMANDD